MASLVAKGHPLPQLQKKMLTKRRYAEEKMGRPFSLGCMRYAVSSHLRIHAERSSNLSLWPKPIQLAWRVLSRHFLSKCVQAVTQDAPKLCHVDNICFFSVELFTRSDYKTGCFLNMKEKRPKTQVWFLQEKGREKMVVSACACKKELFHGTGEGLLCAVE